MIRSPVRGERHAVVLHRRLARDQPVGDVFGDALGVALLGIAEAAAAGQFEPREIPGRYGLASLGADRPSGDERDAPERAHAAAVAPARRIADALEIAQQAARRAVCAAELDHL